MGTNEMRWDPGLFDSASTEIGDYAPEAAATHRPPVWRQFYGMAQVQRRGEEDAALVPKLIEATRDA